MPPMNVIFLTALLIGQGKADADDAAAAIAIAQAQASLKKPVVKEVAPAANLLQDAFDKASKLSQAVVVSLQGEPCRIGGCVCVSVDSMPGQVGPATLFAVQRDGQWKWYKMQPGASDQEVANEVNRRIEEVSQAANPFDPFSDTNQRMDAGQAADRLGAGNRGLRFNSSHQCPTCGASQYVVSGRGPGNTHTHTCSRCGTSWYH
jgi:predicted Zn finger-like uncharacterized protein